MLLETYSSLEGEALRNSLPSFLNIVKQVTGDPFYSMFNLSLKEDWSKTKKFCHSLNGTFCANVRSYKKNCAIDLNSVCFRPQTRKITRLQMAATTDRVMAKFEGSRARACKLLVNCSPPEAHDSCTNTEKKKHDKHANKLKLILCVSV